MKITRKNKELWENFMDQTDSDLVKSYTLRGPRNMNPRGDSKKDRIGHTTYHLIDMICDYCPNTTQNRASIGVLKNEIQKVLNTIDPENDRIPIKKEIK